MFDLHKKDYIVCQVGIICGTAKNSYEDSFSHKSLKKLCSQPLFLRWRKSVTRDEPLTLVSPAKNY